MASAAASSNYYNASASAGPSSNYTTTSSFHDDKVPKFTDYRSRVCQLLFFIFFKEKKNIQYLI